MVVFLTRTTPVRHVDSDEASQHQFAETLVDRGFGSFLTMQLLGDIRIGIVDIAPAMSVLFRVETDETARVRASYSELGRTSIRTRDGSVRLSRLPDRRAHL